MPHLKFFQEHCSLVIDQQRGQWCWHMLKNITLNARMGVALIRMCNCCFRDTNNIKVEIKFIK